MPALDRDKIIDDAVVQALIRIEKPSGIIRERLAERGYYIINPDDVEWSDLQAFLHERSKGQSVMEDMGGYVLRTIRKLLRMPVEPVDLVKARKAAHRFAESVHKNNK